MPAGSPGSCEKPASAIGLTDDSTSLTLNLSETRGNHYDSVLATRRPAAGGRKLIERGLDADIRAAARADVTDLAPELSRNPWRITANAAS